MEIVLVIFDSFPTPFFRLMFNLQSLFYLLIPLITKFDGLILTILFDVAKL